MKRNDGTHDSDPNKSPSSKGPDKKNTHENDGPQKKTSWTNLSHESICGKWSLRVTRDRNILPHINPENLWCAYMCSVKMVGSEDNLPHTDTLG